MAHHKPRARRAVRVQRSERGLSAQFQEVVVNEAGIESVSTGCVVCLHYSRAWTMPYDPDTRCFSRATWAGFLFL